MTTSSVVSVKCAPLPNMSALIDESQELSTLGLHRQALLSACAGLYRSLVDRARAHGIGDRLTASFRPTIFSLVKNSEKLTKSGLLGAAFAERMPAIEVAFAGALGGRESALQVAVAQEAIGLARQISALPIDLQIAGQLAVDRILPRGGAKAETKPRDRTHITDLSLRAMESEIHASGCESTAAELLEQGRRLADMGLLMAALAGPLATAIELIVKTYRCNHIGSPDGSPPQAPKLNQSIGGAITELVEAGQIDRRASDEAFAAQGVCRAAKRGCAVMRSHYDFVVDVAARFPATAETADRQAAA